MAAVNTAIKTGKLKKANKCEHPGCNETKVEGHHYLGYDKEHWLDVKRLCKTHHDREYETKLTYNGETKTIATWARETGLKHNTIRNRIAAGWPIDKVLGQPLMVA